MKNIDEFGTSDDPKKEELNINITQLPEGIN